MAVAAILWSLAVGSGRAQAPPAPAAPPAADGIDKRSTSRGRPIASASPNASRARATRPSTEACKTLTQVLRNDLRFEGVQLVPENLIAAIPPLNPDAPNFVDWQGIGATMLVTMRASVTAGELTFEATLHAVGVGKTILAKRYAGKADNPRVFAHQLSDEILALAQLQGRRAQQDRVRVRPRLGGQAETKGDLHHGLRRLQPPPRDRERLDQHPARLEPGRPLARVRLLSRRPAGPLPRLDLRGQEHERPRRPAGQVLAPAFSPDGKRIAYASSRGGGNSDIWVANADGTERAS